MVDLVPLTPADIDDLEATMLEYLPRYYADVDSSLVEQYVRAALDQRAVNPTTTAVEIWKAVEAGAQAGYAVLVWKQWRTLKAGPCVIKTEFQQQGIGRRFHALLSDRAKATHVRKVFCTFPTTLPAHAALVLEAGFTIEAHLKRHYSEWSDELVAGKATAPTAKGSDDADNQRQALRLLREHRQERSSHYVAWWVDDEPGAHGLTEFLRRVLPHFYDALDLNLPEVLVSTRSRSPDQVCRKRPGFLCLGDAVGRIVAVTWLSLKRGSLLKARVIPALDEPEVYSIGRREIRQRARLLKARKVSYEFPVVASHCLPGLSQDVEIEGILRQPYKEGIDMVIAGEFLEQGGADG